MSQINISHPCMYIHIVIIITHVLIITDNCQPDIHTCVSEVSKFFTNNVALQYTYGTYSSSAT